MLLDARGDTLIAVRENDRRGPSGFFPDTEALLLSCRTDGRRMRGERVGRAAGVGPRDNGDV
jgi:hypothetical protein